MKQNGRVLISLSRALQDQRRVIRFAPFRPPLARP